VVAGLRKVQKKSKEKNALECNSPFQTRDYFEKQAITINQVIYDTEQYQNRLSKLRQAKGIHITKHHWPVVGDGGKLVDPSIREI
jgi:hypothetical protein